MLQLLTYDQIESIKKVRKDKQSPNYIFVHEKDEVKEQLVSSSERWGEIKRKNDKMRRIRNFNWYRNFEFYTMDAKLVLLIIFNNLSHVNEPLFNLINNNFNENGKTKINRGINISFDLISNKLKTILENTFLAVIKINIKNII